MELFRLENRKRRAYRRLRQSHDKAALRRLPVAHRMDGPGPAPGRHLGPRQQRRDANGPLRNPGLRLIHREALPRRPGRLRLRPDPAHGKRLPQARPMAVV